MILLKIFVMMFVLSSFNVAKAKEIDLSGLKDVILGEKPSLFPLPIGWWIVIGFIVILLIISLFLIKRKLFPSSYLYTKNEINA